MEVLILVLSFVILLIIGVPIAFSIGIAGILTMLMSIDAMPALTTYDALGSVMEITDMNEAVAVSYRYDPYGAVTITRNSTTQSSDPLGNPWMFTARFADEETGIYYYRARSYSAVTGRFLQRDPLGTQFGSNAYEYVQSRPIDVLDPSGRYPVLTGLPDHHEKVNEVVRLVLLGPLMLCGCGGKTTSGPLRCICKIACRATTVGLASGEYATDRQIQDLGPCTTTAACEADCETARKQAAKDASDEQKVAPIDHTDARGVDWLRVTHTNPISKGTDNHIVPSGATWTCTKSASCQ